MASALDDKNFNERYDNDRCTCSFSAQPDRGIYI
jgi:hypothetical protein